MKRNIIELDVDFIGEQNQPMTRKEQTEISVFIKNLKKERKIKNNGNISTRPSPSPTRQSATTR